MPHILVFDSGIGGTSVLERIRAKLPFAEYSYVMDNALLPYGLQSEETIQKRLRCLVQRLGRFHRKVDLIVIACNTASTYALATTRQCTDIPIVGVVPAIKPAAAMSQTKRIALLATPATSSNQYTRDLITNHAMHCQVDLHQSTKLVRLAELYYWQQILDEQAIAEELSHIGIHPDVDSIVLGCTHFPILAQSLAAFYTEQVALVDSGDAIANRVRFLLADKLKSSHVKNEMPLRFYATASDISHYNKEVKLLPIELSC